MSATETIMVIHDGSLAALVACLMAPDAAELIAWVPPARSGLRMPGSGDAEQRAMVAQQAELLGIRRVINAKELTKSDDPASAAEKSLTLLAAVAEARMLNCSRVVWPIVCNGNLASLFETTERASLITRLSWLDEEGVDRTLGIPGPPTGSAAPRSIRIETPFADLTPHQVREMADDLDAPLQAAWWTDEARV